MNLGFIITDIGYILTVATQRRLPNNRTIYGSGACPVTARSIRIGFFSYDFHIVACVECIKAYEFDKRFREMVEYANSFYTKICKRIGAQAIAQAKPFKVKE